MNPSSFLYFFFLSGEPTYGVFNFTIDAAVTDCIHRDGRGRIERTNQQHPSSASLYWDRHSILVRNRALSIPFRIVCTTAFRAQEKASPAPQTILSRPVVPLLSVYVSLDVQMQFGTPEAFVPREVLLQIYIAECIRCGTTLSLSLAGLTSRRLPCHCITRSGMERMPNEHYKKRGSKGAPK